MCLKGFSFITAVMILALFLSFFTVDRNAFAQDYKIQQTFQKELKDFEPVPDEDYFASSKVLSDVPYGDRDLAFKLRIPSSWEPSFRNLGVASSLSNRLLTDVVSYRSKPRLSSARSRFVIKAMKLEEQITADQWYYQYVMSNAYTLEGIKVINSRKLEAVHVEVEKDFTFAVYTLAQINGSKIVLAQYYIPAENWTLGRRFAQRSLREFELLHADSSLIEGMQDYNVLDISTISYPVSWIFRTVSTRTIDRMKLQISNEFAIEDQKRVSLEGQIDISLISSYAMMPLTEEIEQVKSDLRRKGILVAELKEEIDDVKFHDSVEYGFLRVYEASNTNTNMSQYEVWLSILAIKDYFYLLVLSTPHRDGDFSTWSKNTEAFRAVLQKVRPQTVELTIHE